MGAKPMFTKTIFRAPVAAVISGWVILISAVAVYATIPDANDAIHGCYDHSGGNLRVIDNSVTNCKANETALNWNATGPQGPAGPAGASGTAGPTGPAGATGPAGPQGLTGGTGPTGATGPQGPAGADRKGLRAVALSSTDTRCGGLGGFEVFQHDPVTNVDTSRGVMCKGAPGAAGGTGPTGPTGPAGPAGTAGATGAQGPAGPTGPSGPAG